MILTLPVPITDKDKKLAEIFIFTTKKSGNKTLS